MQSNTKKNAIVFLTHFYNRYIQKEYSSLITECSDGYDVYILCDNSKQKFERYKSNKNFVLFSTEHLAALPYPGKSSLDNLACTNQGDAHHRRFNFNPGNVELPVLFFSQQAPDYDYYWVIEYDVRFSGSWRDFLSFYDTNNADLLGTTLTRRENVPDWYHWPSLDLLDKPIGNHQQIRGFFPIYRLSKRALQQLDSDYRDGVSGHFECLIPTLLANAGMTIEDFGGTGEFVRPGNTNRVYRNTFSTASLAPGTFVFRPVLECPGQESNMLWHPVKSTSRWQAVQAFINGVYRQTVGQLATAIRSLL